MLGMILVQMGLPIPTLKSRDWNHLGPTGASNVSSILGSGARGLSGAAFPVSIWCCTMSLEPAGSVKIGQKGHRASFVAGQGQVQNCLHNRAHTGVLVPPSILPGSSHHIEFLKQILYKLTYSHH